MLILNSLLTGVILEIKRPTILEEIKASKLSDEQLAIKYRFSLDFIARLRRLAQRVIPSK